MCAAAAGSASYPYLKDEIDAVQQRYDEGFRSSSKIRASSGLLIYDRNEQGDIKLLLGRARKVGKDPENVHGTFVSFAGKVEPVDFRGSFTPVLVNAAAREVTQETNGLLKEDEMIRLIAEKRPACVKNGGWERFCAPIFLAPVDSINSIASVQIDDEAIKRFNKNPSEEISEMKWIPLQGVLDAVQKKKDEYNTKLGEIEAAAGLVLDDKQRYANKELSAIAKSHIVLPYDGTGDQDIVARYVANTICEAHEKYFLQEPIAKLIRPLKSPF